MIKKGFILRKMVGMNLVVPAGTNIKEVAGALILNDTGAFIFESLQKGKSADQIADALSFEYGICSEIALADVLSTIESLKEAGVIED